MGEIINLQNEKPIHSSHEAMERLNVEQLVDYILEAGEHIGLLERNMNIAADVLTGYGTSIEEELRKREGDINA